MVYSEFVSSYSHPSIPRIGERVRRGERVGWLREGVEDFFPHCWRGCRRRRPPFVWFIRRPIVFLADASTALFFAHRDAKIGELASSLLLSPQSLSLHPRFLSPVGRSKRASRKMKPMGKGIFASLRNRNFRGEDRREMMEIWRTIISLVPYELLFYDPSSADFYRKRCRPHVVSK